MGIKVAGDPHWFDHLDADRRRTVLGLLYAEAHDAPPAPAPEAPPPPKLPQKTGNAAYDNLLDILASPDA